jgi:hypothetical protein
MDEHIKTEKHQTDCSGFIVVASTQSFLDRDYSLLNHSLCKFGILSKDLQQSPQRGTISNQARTARLAYDKALVGDIARSI